MVRTLGVIIVAVGALLLVLPQPPPIVQPGPDAVAAAGQAARSLGFAPLVAAPSDLGAEWSVQYARIETTEGVLQWRAGYLSPDGRRVDVEQARDVTVEWVRRESSRPAATVGAEPTGEEALDLDTDLGGSGVAQVEVAGVVWWRIERGDGVVALVRQVGDTTVMVSVTARRALADQERVAALLSPADVASVPEPS